MKAARNRPDPQTLALGGLAWLAATDDELSRFVGGSGIGPKELRERAAEPEVLGAVLDFLLGDDKRLLAFCEAEGLEPKQVHLARHALGRRG